MPPLLRLHGAALGSAFSEADARAEQGADAYPDREPDASADGWADRSAWGPYGSAGLRSVLCADVVGRFVRR